MECVYVFLGDTCNNGEYQCFLAIKENNRKRKGMWQGTEQTHLYRVQPKVAIYQRITILHILCSMSNLSDFSLIKSSFYSNNHSLNQSPVLTTLSND